MMKLESFASSRLFTYCTLAIALAASIVAPATSHAQFAIDKTELFLSPADSAARSGILTVRNEGATRAQATIKIEDWDRAEDGGNRFFAAGTLPQSCAAALKLFPLTLSLGPGESQAVRIDMDAAGARSLGNRECWSVVLVESAVPETNASGRTLIYRLRTGMKVYVMPSGLSADGQVSDVAIHAASSPTAGANDTVEVAFQNTGSKHVVGRGRVEIRRPDNSTAAVVDLPLAYALPGATMRVRAALPALAVGKYVVLAVMDYGGSEIAAAQLEHEVRADDRN
jgi:P pilus assembly chaperone PapD